MIDIKSCPFCDCRPSYDHTKSDGVRFSCGYCEEATFEDFDAAALFWNTRAEGPAQVSAPLDREWVARIIDPLGWQLFDEVVRVQQLPPSEAQAAFEACPAAPWSAKERTDIALAKADAILALSQQDQVGLTTPAVLGEPSADAWIEWKGGENPAPGMMVRYRMRDWHECECDSDSLPWVHDGRVYDIIAYRVVSPPPPAGGVK